MGVANSNALGLPCDNITSSSYVVTSGFNHVDNQSPAGPLFAAPPAINIAKRSGTIPYPDE